MSSNSADMKTQLIDDLKGRHLPAMRDSFETLWSAPRGLVHLKWEFLGTLCRGGTHAEATDRRRSEAIARGFRPRPGQGPDRLRCLPQGRDRRDDLLSLATAA